MKIDTPSMVMVWANLWIVPSSCENAIYLYVKIFLPFVAPCSVYSLFITRLSTGQYVLNSSILPIFCRSRTDGQASRFNSGDPGYKVVKFPLI